MSVPKNAVIDITPQMFRDYLVVNYFTPGILNSPMVWGPPGVGKSSSVAQAAKDVTEVLNYAIKHLINALRKYQNGREVFSRAMLTLLMNSYPVIDRSKGAVSIYVTWECTKNDSNRFISLTYNNRTYCATEWQQVLQNPPENLHDIIRSASPIQIRRVEELRAVVNALMEYVGRIDLDALASRLGLKRWPIVIVNDRLDLLDYTYLIIKSDIEDRLTCVAKNERCYRARGERGIVATHEDADLLSYVYAKLREYGSTISYAELQQAVATGEVVLPFILFHFVDIRLSQLELDDIKGVPSDVLARVAALNKGVEAAKAQRVLWLAPAWLVRGGLGFIFFDEINQAQRHVQGAAYMLILDRKVTSGYSISANVAVVAAGNQPSFAPEVALELATPLLDRLKPQFNMVPKIEVAPAELKELVRENYSVFTDPTMALSRYLSEMGYAVPQSLVNSAMSIAEKVKVPELERVTIPVTPRGVEFLARLYKSPAEFGLLSSLVPFEVGFMAPPLYLLMTFYGLFGHSTTEIGEYTELRDTFYQEYLGVVSTLILVKMLGERDFARRVQASLILYRIIGERVGRRENVLKVLEAFTRSIAREIVTNPEKRSNLEQNFRDLGLEIDCNTKELKEVGKNELREELQRHWWFVFKVLATSYCETTKRETERGEGKGKKERKFSA